MVLNQDGKDERMGQDYGLTPPEKAAKCVGAYGIRPLHILNTYCGLYWRTGPLPSVKNDRHFL